MEGIDSVETIVERWLARPFGFVGAEPDDDTGGNGGDGGGADGTTGSGDQGAGDGGGNSDDDDNLGDAGKQAIERERQAAQRARDRYKPWAQLSRETGLTVEQIRERLNGGGGTGGGNSGGDGNQVSQADVDAARREAAAEATAKANRRIVKAEVKALAADTFADPADATLFLDLDEIEVDEDGEVDTEAIKRALKDVLRRKPHLAKRKGSTTTSGGSPDGGARETPPKPKGMSDLIRNARR